MFNSVTGGSLASVQAARLSVPRSRLYLESMARNQALTLIDNWLLELACNAVANDLPPPKVRSNVYEAEWQYYMKVYVDYEQTIWASTLALIHLLDLLVVNDGIVYDSSYSLKWRELAEREEIGPLLTCLLSVSPDIPTRNHLNSFDVHNPRRNRVYDNEIADNGHHAEAVTRDGALYYLGLSRLLGVYYWPSPWRARYLQEHEFSGTAGLNVRFSEAMRETMNELAADVLTQVGEMRTLYFWGYATQILASSSSRQEIFARAVEFREKRECRAFRDWLRNIDNALEEGNLATVAREMSDIHSEVRRLREKLGLVEKDSLFQFQLGLSPSIKLDSLVLSSVMSVLRRRRYHITFLRHSLAHIVSKGNLSSQIHRLFPETARTGIVDRWY